jgi:hypothetical protein
VGADRGWRAVVAERARTVAEAPESGLLCVATLAGDLEIWDRRHDRLLSRQTFPALAQLLALPDACASRAATGAVRLHRRDGAHKALTSGATALAWDGREILVASGAEIVAFGPTGARRAAHAADLGVSAILRAGPWLILGYAEGNLERSGARAQPRLAFEEVAAGAVTHLVRGPMGTVIAGYANGSFGIWSAEDGRRLHHGRLHGPIAHVLVEERRLCLASELGDRVALDLGVLHAPYCSVMREVWRSVPVVWGQGRPAARLASPDHRCMRPEAR